MTSPMEEHQMESSVPPGFRSHPTEEELVGYYLVKKINSLEIDVDFIVEIDLYRMEPWEIQGNSCLKCLHFSIKCKWFLDLA